MQETLWGEQRTQYPHAPANATNGHAVTAVAHARGNARTRAAHLRVRLQRILELTQVEHRQLARPPLDPFADARGNCRRRSCSAAGWTQAPEQRGEQSSEDGGPIVIDAADVRALASCVRPSTTPCKTQAWSQSNGPVPSDSAAAHMLVHTCTWACVCTCAPVCGGACGRPTLRTAPSLCASVALVPATSATSDGGTSTVGSAAPT